ncbi:MAG TPA: zinc ribbon domain-containing protein [Chloroflexota bacterium]|jgi:putative FmdB family regulatory protein|nr:zinc ribbon domain-containing protein [Chloroflexota bacterium]
MPVYEYRCGECRRRSEVFFSSFSAVSQPVCPHCGSGKMAKLVSRVAILKSEESRLEALADPSSLSGLDESDPKSVAAWARRMGSELGEDLGSDFDEMVDAMERGEDPMGMGEEGGGDFGGGDDFGGGAGDDFGGLD